MVLFHSPESKPANAAEAIDANSGCHFLPPKHKLYCLSF
jgi:hypothetical protein